MSDIELKNWMSKIDDFIKITDINIPGTHDSLTRFCQFSLFSKCQSLSLNQMLEIGVRALDLRVNGAEIVHSFCKCKKSRFGSVLTIYDVLDEIYSFLNDNPDETLLLFFKNDGKIDGQTSLKLLREEIFKRPEMWYCENIFPILREARGKIILLNRIDATIGIDFSSMPYQGNTNTAQGEMFSPNQIDNIMVQDRYLLPSKRKWSEAVKTILKDEFKYDDFLVLNFLSSAGIPFVPKFNSKYVNKQFLNFPLKALGNYGILMFDFITSDISKKIIDTNF